MTESIRSAFSSFMGRFKNSRLARMSSGHYCLIRDLGLVKGGKGLRHHEVVIDFSWRGLLKLAVSAGTAVLRRRAPVRIETAE
ncbi:hypothetical protein RYA05_35010 [Pseudomonas syringae pv. actinidiae]|nr:hypothetical protein [Pseudomonas syringae pv. actinidiae]